MSKNKKIKRIICIFFATIICFSTVACSGACYESCFNIVFSNRIKNGKLEAKKQKKALDSAPIEIDGYKLKFDRRRDIYKTEESWIILSSHYYHSFSSEYNGKTATLEVTREHNSAENKDYDVFYLTETVENEVVEKMISAPSQEIGFEYRKIDELIAQGTTANKIIYCLDGAWFVVVQYIGDFDFWTRNKYYTATLDFPPLFYMLDFENQKLLYAGYADGWYEELKNQSYLNMPEMPYIKIERS